MPPSGPQPRDRFIAISPCRNEARYLQRCIDSVLKQSVRPDLWIVVDDGSSDRTPEILAEYEARHNWIRVVKRRDRGSRAVGPGVVQAFYDGLAEVDLDDFEYLCKLDLDLELPSRYFELLIDRMRAMPRLGSCSGKPYSRSASGKLTSERCGDEMSVGMTKFYRISCFRDIGGFVHGVMWDGIDCHKARQLGWTVRSWDEPELRFEHLRPMGASQRGILTGRSRHGSGQYFMGSDPFYFVATAAYRMLQRPYIIGGIAMIWGFLAAALRQDRQHDDPDLRRFLRRYQRLALFMGKRRAIEAVEREQASRWNGAAAREAA